MTTLNTVIKALSAMLLLPFFMLFFPSILSADENDLDAQLQIAQRYLNEQEFDKAIEIYQKVSQEGHELADFSLGLIYELGQGVVVDDVKACEYFERAAQKGIPLALYKTGLCKRKDINNPLHKNIAIEYFEKAFQSGIYQAGCDIGVIILEQAETKEQVKTGIEWCSQSASSGSVDASLQLGKWAYSGTYIEQDFDTAIKFLEVSRPNDNPIAALWLAKAYDAKATPNDKIKALYFYEKAASKGLSEAYLPTALFYYHKHINEADEQGRFIGKAYLWSTSAYLIAKQNKNDNKINDAKVLRDPILEIIPQQWQASFNGTIKDHFAKYHPEQNANIDF